MAEDYKIQLSHAQEDLSEMADVALRVRRKGYFFRTDAERLVWAFSGMSKAQGYILGIIRGSQMNEAQLIATGLRKVNDEIEALMRKAYVLVWKALDKNSDVEDVIYKWQCTKCGEILDYAPANKIVVRGKEQPTAGPRKHGAPCKGILIPLSDVESSTLERKRYKKKEQKEKEAQAIANLRARSKKKQQRQQPHQKSLQNYEK